MNAGIGLGLLLNILFWAVAFLVAVGLGSLSVIRYFPGREQKARKGTRQERGGARAARGSVEADGTGERYRKAS